MRYKQFLTMNEGIEHNPEAMEFLKEMIALADLREYLHSTLNEDAAVSASLKGAWRKRDTAFKKIQNIGKKLGLKVEKSESAWSFFKKAKPKGQIFTMLALEYLGTDVTDRQGRKAIVNVAKKHIGSMEKREIANFILMLDANTTHMTVMIRHLIQAAFGIEIGTYAKWLSDREYIKQQIKHIDITMNRMDDMDKEKEAFRIFKNKFLSWELNQMVMPYGAKTYKV